MGAEVGGVEGGGAAAPAAGLDERIASTLPEIAAHFTSSVGQTRSRGRRRMPQLKKSLSFVAEDRDDAALENEEEEEDDDDE